MDFVAFGGTYVLQLHLVYILILLDSAIKDVGAMW